MTKYLTSLVLLFSLTITAAAQTPTERGETRALAPETVSDSLAERNKARARAFYEDLWLSDRTDRFDRYVAEEYVVHDIGERKNVTEPAIRQKEIADFFHAQGDMTGHIDFQIAEEDLVATRWQVRFEPSSFWMRLMGGREQIPIINVFRFRDGKIVEIWNHRHDIDTWRGTLPFAKGLGIGLLFALIGWGVAFVQWRRRRTA
jgi:predicted SnoaL-like aldol condensation-catalyzing enzyme